VISLVHPPPPSSVLFYGRWSEAGPNGESSTHGGVRRSGWSSARGRLCTDLQPLLPPRSPRLSAMGRDRGAALGLESPALPSLACRNGRHRADRVVCRVQKWGPRRWGAGRVRTVTRRDPGRDGRGIRPQMKRIARCGNRTGHSLAECRQARDAPRRRAFEALRTLT
jgi:hypothetical protein